MRWLWSLLLVFVLPSLVHAADDCREVIMWDGGAGPYATRESACYSIKPDHAERFAGLYYCNSSSCVCGWHRKGDSFLFTWGTVWKVVTYEGDSCPGQNQCADLEGQTRHALLRFPAGSANPIPSGPVEIDGCEAVEAGEDGKIVSVCLVDPDDPSAVLCGTTYRFTGRPADAGLPGVNIEPLPSDGETDSRTTEVHETVSPPSTVTNPDGSTTTVTVEEKTVSNPPSAVITETDRSVEFVQTSATSYDKITTVTTTTTNPDGTQVVVTEVTRERHTVPSYHTVIDRTTGSYSQTVTPGRTETGTTTTTEYVDADGNVTSRTVIHHGGGGQGVGGVGAPGDQLPQSTCGGPGQPPCRVEFDESNMPADPGGDQFSGLLDGTGIDSLIDGLASPPSMPSINPLPDLPDGGGVCQTLTLRWRSWSLTFPDAEQCAKLHQMQEYLAWALYIWTVYGIFAMITTKKES